MKYLLGFIALIASIIMPLVHAETLRDLLPPINTSSGLTIETEGLLGQYSHLFTLQTSRHFTRKAIKEIIALESEGAKKIRDNLKSIISPDAGTGGYDISEKVGYKAIQSYELSCESASASSILTYLLGQKVTEDTVIEKLHKTFWKQSKLVFNIWGDPDKGFVGNISGSQRLQTGFGVYEKPFLSIYTSYDLKTEKINQSDYPRLGITQKEHLTKILTALESGSMVQLWGDYCTDKESDDGIFSSVSQNMVDTFGINAHNTCKTPDAKKRLIEWKIVDQDLGIRTITTLIGEHNFFLLGWKGSKENPTHIIVWDTISGRHVYPIYEWMRKWDTLDDRSIIVSK